MKIIRPQVLGIWLTHKHNKSIKIGRKLASVCFELFGTAHKCHKFFLATQWPSMVKVVNNHMLAADMDSSSYKFVASRVGDLHTSSMLSSLTSGGLFFCFGAGFGLAALAALAFLGDCGFFSFPLAGVLDWLLAPFLDLLGVLEASRACFPLAAL